MNLLHTLVAGCMSYREFLERRDMLVGYWLTLLHCRFHSLDSMLWASQCNNYGSADCVSLLHLYFSQGSRACVLLPAGLGGQLVFPECVMLKQ